MTTSRPGWPALASDFGCLLPVLVPVALSTGSCSDGLIESRDPAGEIIVSMAVHAYVGARRSSRPASAIP